MRLSYPYTPILAMVRYVFFILTHLKGGKWNHVVSFAFSWLPVRLSTRPFFFWIVCSYPLLIFILSFVLYLLVGTLYIRCIYNPVTFVWWNFYFQAVACHLIISSFGSFYYLRGQNNFWLFWFLFQNAFPYLKIIFL